MIASRLDRLEPVNKRVLQEASVIGRTFFYQVLERTTAQSVELRGRLEHIEDTDMIRALSMEPDLEYMFKHPLTREVVYNSLLLNERKAIHEKVGAVMESLLADRLPEFYETLAHHFLNGQQTEKAVRYLIGSGQKALDNLNLEESARYFQSAYELLEPKPNKTGEEWNLFYDLLDAWALNFYYFGTFPKLIDLFGKHEDHAETLPDKARQGMFFGWLGFAYWSWGRHGKAHPYLQKALTLAEESGNHRVIAHICTWASWLYADLARYDEGIALGERAARIAREYFPTEPYINFKSLCGVAVNYFYKGDPGKCLEQGEAAVAYSRRYGSLRGEALGLVLVAGSEQVAGNLATAAASYDQAAGVAVDPFYEGIPTVLSTVTNAAAGNFDRARETLPAAEKCVGDGAELFLPYVKVAQGLLAFADGRFSRGLRDFSESMEVYRANGGVHPIYIHGLGKCYLMLLVGDKPPLGVMLKNIGFLLKTLPVAAKRAERYLTEALAVAESVGCDTIAGQAHLDLGVLFKVRKKRERSIQHLKKAEEIFQRTQATGFLAQTREALAELGTQAK